MKLVIQRVNKGEVGVGGEVVGKINKGLFVLLGIKSGDSHEDIDFLVSKLLKMRILADKNGKMNLSVLDVGGELLVVSQFTLHADTTKGNRPSFIDAAKPEEARELYEYFVERLKASKLKVETGKFGEYMSIDTQIDGPVTIILDSNG